MFLEQGLWRLWYCLWYCNAPSTWQHAYFFTRANGGGSRALGTSSHSILFVCVLCVYVLCVFVSCVCVRASVCSSGAAAARGWAESAVTMPSQSRAGPWFTAKLFFWYWLIWLFSFWASLTSPLIIRQRAEIQYQMIWLSSHLTLSFDNQW
jgi:hypothetical protein